jgi:hypothetical protein
VYAMGEKQDGRGEAGMGGGVLPSPIVPSPSLFGSLLYMAKWAGHDRHGLGTKKKHKHDVRLCLGRWFGPQCRHGA